MAVSGEKRPPRPAPASGGMAKKLILALFVSVSALVYRQIQPPPPKIPGSPGGPPVTANRTRLSDGRHLAYLESGVPKEEAKYKIIFVHGFDSCRYDALPISTELAQKLGIYLLSFDRPGYAESDPHPGRTEKSIALDIAELADNLQLGPRFHLAGFSMGGEIMWSCLKYIPYRLSGVAILGPVGNYWWPGLPSDVSWEAWYQQLPQDQWAVWVSHHLPWLTYWWNSQKLFPASSVIAYNPALLLLFAWAACTLPTSCSCVLLAWAACAAGLLLPWPIAGLQLLGLHSCCPARGPAGSPACRTPAALGRTPRAVRWAVRVARAGCWASRSTHAAAALRCAAPARTPVPPTPAHRRQERTNTKNS